MKKYLFKGIPELNHVDESIWDSKEIKNGYVYGNLVTDANGKHPFIVGEVVESTGDYIILGYWYPVREDSVELVVINDI